MHRSRRRWIVVLAIVALACIAFLVLRALLQPARLSAFLLHQAEQVTGLTLTLDEPADIGLWPDLHIELTGLSATAPGATRPLLRAGRVEAALPWSTLRGQDVSVRGLRLISAQLDLPATLAFFSQGQEAGPPAPLRLPSLDAPLEIRDGRIHGDDWALDALDLTLPSLRDGIATRMTLRGNLVQNEASQPFALQLSTTPHTDGATLRLAELTLDMVLDALPAWRPHIEGEAIWNPAGMLAFDLRSLIAPWPENWPALPFPPSDDDAVNLSLRYDGDTALTGAATFSLLRGDDGARGTFTLDDTLTWLRGERTSPLPPLRGSMDIKRLQYGSIEAHGIRIKTQPDDADAEH